MPETIETETTAKVRRITENWLARHFACDGQRELFVERWPKGADVTAKNIRTASEIGLNIDWFAEHILPKGLYAEWRAKRDTLDAEWRAKRDTLYAEYEAKRDTLYAEYEAKRDTLYAEWRAKRAPLDAEWRAKRDTLYAEWRAKRAPLDAEWRAKCDTLYAEYEAKRDTLLIALLGLEDSDNA